MQEIVALAKTYTKQHETGSQAIFRPSSSSSLLETVSAISMPVTGTATEQLSLSDSVERSTVLEPYIKYYYDVGEGGGPAVAMQRLCHAIGFAHYDTSRGMCTHPIFGPWFAMYVNLSRLDSLILPVLSPGSPWSYCTLSIIADCICVSNTNRININIMFTFAYFLLLM